MVDFLLRNIQLILIVLPQLFYLTKKNFFFPIYCLFCFYWLNKGIDIILLAEISSLFSVFFAMIYRSKFKVANFIYLSLFSTGCLFVALYENNSSFLEKCIALFLQPQDHNVDMVLKLFYSISILLLIGCIPFTELIVHLFSSMNLVLRTTCLVMPLFFSLQAFQNIFFEKNTIQLAFYFASVVCIYSCICILYNKNIQSILIYVITFFYGLQIILLTNKYVENSIIFLSTAMLINCVYEFFLSKKKKYKIMNLKMIFCIDKTSMLFSLISFLMIFVFYITSICLINTKYTNQIVQAGIFTFFCFFAKIILYTNVSKNVIKTFTNPDKKKSIQFILSISSIILLFFLSYFNNNYNIINGVNLKAINTINFSILILSILMPFFLHKMTLNITQPKILSVSSYVRPLRKIVIGCQIFCKIINAIAVDFYTSCINLIISYFRKNSLNKFLFIIKNDGIYFYIFMLISINIILIVECIIN